LTILNFIDDILVNPLDCFDENIEPISASEDIKNLICVASPLHPIT
jgi:hypothetical protein